MTKEICENPRIAYYWLTSEERDANQEKLKSEYREWKKKGYRVCTFISGKENLVELTKELLLHNKEVATQ